MSQRTPKRTRATTPRQQDRRKCPHCGNGAETFRYVKKLWKFDVDLARRLVQDGREPVELEPEDVEFSVSACRIYAEHVQHVDPQYPGIIAHIWYPEPNGDVAHGHLLIDGHHRAARCLELGRPYFVYILSEDESRKVTLRGPDIEKILRQLESPAASIA